MKEYQKITIDGQRYNLVPVSDEDNDLECEEEKAVKTSPFNFVDGKYYYIGAGGQVVDDYDTQGHADIMKHDVANYCTDKDLIQQQAYREILNRLLWKYSYENGAEEIDWENPEQAKHKIIVNHEERRLEISDNEIYQDFGNVYFRDAITARKAIDEIVLPFIKSHPDIEI